MTKSKLILSLDLIISNSRTSPGDMLFTDASNVFHLASVFLIAIIMSPSFNPFSKLELSFKATVKSAGILLFVSGSV